MFFVDKNLIKLPEQPLSLINLNNECFALFKILKRHYRATIKAFL
jgi:hypothetical protein